MATANEGRVLFPVGGATLETFQFSSAKAQPALK